MSKDYTNAERANRARKALVYYAEILGDATQIEVNNERYDEAITDLLTDLIHLYHTVTPGSEGKNPDDIELTANLFTNLTAAAAINFEEEAKEEA